jgi:UDP-3-O-[3-hydroxymyristoyl] glucosamine N-acyltransferase
VKDFNYIFQHGCFKLRDHFNSYLGVPRKIWLQILGMKIGANTTIPKINITWPHKVSLGNKCVLEPGISFKYDGLWEKGVSIDIGDDVFIGRDCEFNISESIKVGKNSLIASGCRFIDHDHGMGIGLPMREQTGIKKPIVIGEDVWIGCNVVVLKGVSIGNGAIIAAGAIVTKPILPNEIWGGVPAKKLSERK